MTIPRTSGTRRLLVIALASVVVSCGSGTAGPQASPTPLATCSANCVTEFATAASAIAPPPPVGTPVPGAPLDLVTGIAAGTDGAVWFFEVNTNKLGRLATDGMLSEFLIPGAPSMQGFVVVAKDGSIWVTGDRAGTLTRRAADGSFTQFPLGLAPNQILRSVLVGPDGEIWYLARGTNKLGRITTAGVITEYPVLPPPTPGVPGPAAQGIGPGVTLGPDNAFWFIDGANGKVGRWSPTRDTKEFDVPGGAGPRITSGPDGALWFTEFAGNKIGRITVDGVVTEFSLPEKTGPIGITAGPDRAIWFTAHGSGKIGRLTSEGQLTQFDIPTAESTPFGIITGTDGNIWFTGGASGKVGRVRLKQ